MCMCVSVESIIMVTRLDMVFPYVKHVAISCVLLIYGYVMFGASHGGQHNQQIKPWTHTEALFRAVTGHVHVCICVWFNVKKLRIVGLA
jgi:hypothetical protein